MFQNKEIGFEWMEISALFGVALVITALISFLTML